MKVEEWWCVCRQHARCVPTWQNIHRDAEITRRIERRPAGYWTADRHVLVEMRKMLQGGAPGRHGTRRRDLKAGRESVRPEAHTNAISLELHKENSSKGAGASQNQAHKACLAPVCHPRHVFGCCVGRAPGYVKKLRTLHRHNFFS